jgi:hypothetical protein
MKRLGTLWLAVEICLLMGVCAWAASSTMRVRVRIFDDAAVYSLPVAEPALASEGWLQQSDISQHGLMEMRNKTTGEDELSHQQEFQNQVIPGKTDKRGFSRARLRQIGGRVELVLDALEFKDEPIKDDKGKDTGKTQVKQIPKQSSIELEFAPKGGSWRDYEDGKTVELRFTRQAIKALLARVKLEANNSSVVEAPESGKASLSITVNPSKVPGRKTSDFGRVSASKKRIDLIQIPTDVLIVMKVSN